MFLSRKMESDVYRTCSDQPAAQCYLLLYHTVLDMTHLTMSVEPLALALMLTLLLLPHCTAAPVLVDPNRLTTRFLLWIRQRRSDPRLSAQTPSFLPTLLFCLLLRRIRGDISTPSRVSCTVALLRVLPLLMTLHATCQFCHRSDFAARSICCRHRFCSYICSAVRLPSHRDCRHP